MRILDKTRLWLRSLFRRSSIDSELEAELRFHLDQLVEEKIASGMSPDDARRAAQRSIGGIAQYQEECRDMRRVSLVEDFVSDIRHAARSLVKSPGFTGVVVAMLALGIGANTAIFTILHGVLVRPLAYLKPDRLMYLSAESPASGDARNALSAPEYMDFRRMNRSFASVGAYSTGGAMYTTGEVNLSAGDRAVRVRSVSIDAHLLEVLGVQPQHGRLFSVEETERWIGTLPPPIAILSHELWRKAFGGQFVIGQKVQIEGRLHEIVGIMPPRIDIMDNRTEVWLPLWLHPNAAQERGAHVLHVVGRLKDGVSPQSAQSELDGLLKNWGDRVGASHHLPTATPVRSADHTLRLRTLQQALVGSASRPILVLQAAVGLILLIVCANLANLLMARARSRDREFALRTALGASRGRLFRQSITECAVLAGTGSILGIVGASAGVRAFANAYPTSIPRTGELAIDLPVVLVALAVSAGTALLFGLLGVRRGIADDMAAALKDGARGSVRSWRHYGRRGLLITQVAFAVMLVIGAGLLVQTVQNLLRADAGFDRSRLVTFSITLPMANSEPDTRAQAYDRVIDGLRGIPGVMATAAMSGLPPDRAPEAIATSIENYVSDSGTPVEIVDYYQFVMGDYFRTTGIPILAGRAFERSDTASAGKVAVVNETFAKRIWKGQNPIGRRLRPPGAAYGASADVWHTVIGVAKDVKQRGVDRLPGTEVYLALDQHGVAPPSMNVVMRTTLSAAALSATIERVVREVDAAVPVVRLRDMDSVFAESIGRSTLLAQLLGAFAGLALVLAAIGTYGVLSCMVAERRREIGIRMALGASRRDVLARIVAQGLQLTGTGVAIGLLGSLAANRLIASLLFGVGPTDLATISSVIATIVAVSAVATWLPAWRASRLDPNVVLRGE